MYHIKADKRAQRSASLIKQGLYQCLKKKEFTNITIADILKESTVGRATFYRLFDSASDVLQYACDLMFTQINDKTNGNFTPKEAMLLDIKTFMSHDLLLETLINSQKINIIYDARYQQIERNTFFKSSQNLSAEQQDFYFSTLTYLLVSTLSTWIKHDKKETAAELFTALQLSVNMLGQTIGK